MITVPQVVEIKIGMLVSRAARFLSMPPTVMEAAAYCPATAVYTMALIAMAS